MFNGVFRQLPQPRIRPRRLWDYARHQPSPSHDGKLEPLHEIKTPGATSFPLLDLPLDIQMETYKTVLKPDNLIIFSHAKAHYFSKCGTRAPKPVYHSHGLAEKGVYSNKTSILRTCKSVHSTDQINSH